MNGREIFQFQHYSTFKWRSRAVGSVEVIKTRSLSWNRVNIKHTERQIGQMYTVPAMQAVRKQDSEPAKNALTATSEKSAFRPGARAQRPPSWIPIAVTFENPHRA
jgi:hypothetical protein